VRRKEELSFSFTGTLLFANLCLLISLPIWYGNTALKTNCESSPPVVVKERVEVPVPAKPVECETPPPRPSPLKEPKVPKNRLVSQSLTTRRVQFEDIAAKAGTDKVQGITNLPLCLEDDQKETPTACISTTARNKKCRPRGHFYHTIYNRWLGEYSDKEADPFQFLEIGFYNGKGFEAYLEFLPKAEAHSMEISCIEQGPRNEGKWPWGNFAQKNEKLYKPLLKQDRLHCGDASEVEFLNKIWTEKMKRPDAPPLKVVIDDASHVARHMAQSVFFWFPRIEPGGLMIVEDIQPTGEANPFRTQFLPQILADLHFCGLPDFPETPCFPTLQPLLNSVHCEMHICVFERNDEPAVELSLKDSEIPPGALDLSTCKVLKK